MAGPLGEMFDHGQLHTFFLVLKMLISIQDAMR